MVSTKANEMQTVELRARMRAIRCELPSDLKAAKGQLQQLTDWRHYVREKPLFTLTTAAALAFIAVPRKSSPSDGKASQQTDVDQSQSMFSAMLGAVTAMMMRNATSYAVKRVSDSLTTKFGPSPAATDEVGRPSITPKLKPQS